MKNLFHDFLISIRITFFMAIILCGIYPLLIYFLGQTLFPHQANGSLIYAQDGRLLGSELLGQNFSSPQFFHPRPSSAGTGWDASNSSGSNLGPTSKSLVDTIRQRVSDYRKENGLADNVSIPADAVTASGSGLDPDISVANAALQLPRVARERHLSEEQLQEILRRHTEEPDLGLFGDTRVNVVTLNLELQGFMKK